MSELDPGIVNRMLEILEQLDENHEILGDENFKNLLKEYQRLPDEQKKVVQKLSGLTAEQLEQASKKYN